MPADPAGDAPSPWLDPDERRTWLALSALTAILPASVETQLSRDAHLSFFEYCVLAALSEQPDRTLAMSQLAMIANGSLSRLSHVARRLEFKGYIRRQPLPQNGRVTVAVLLDAGYQAINEAAPGHVRHVREILFDNLSSEEQHELGRLAVKILGTLDPALLKTLVSVTTNR